MYVKALLILRSPAFVCNIYKNTVPASQRTHSIFIRNANESILFREVIANNYENYKIYIYIYIRNLLMVH